MPIKRADSVVLYSTILATCIACMHEVVVHVAVSYMHINTKQALFRKICGESSKEIFYLNVILKMYHIQTTAVCTVYIVYGTIIRLHLIHMQMVE